MRSFSDMPVGRKLVLLMMLVSGSALALSFGAHLLIEGRTGQREALRELSVLARVVGDSTRAALVFDDPGTAEETLASLKSSPQIDAAFLLAADGRVFARYLKPEGDLWRRPAETVQDLARLCPDCRLGGKEGGSCLRPGCICLWQPLFLDGEHVGTLYLRAVPTELRSRLASSFAAAALVMLVSAAAAWLIARRLQRLLTRPVTAMAQAMERISATADYGLRLPAAGSDEFGRLAVGFNDMLAQVEKRDRQLEQARELLEARVTERTAALLSEIGERRRAEEEVRILSHALEQSADGVIIADLQGGIIYCNEAAAGIYGYPREELLGRSVEVLNTEPELPRDTILPTVRSGQPWSGEAPQKCRDGSVFEAAITVSLVKEQDTTPVGMLGIVRDISARKRSEATLRMLEKGLATTKAGVTITDLKGKIIYTNPAEAAMHGYTVAELLGQPANLLGAPASRRPFFQQTMTTWQRHSLNVRKDGSEFPVQLVSDLVTDARGNPLAIVTVCEDITERKEAERALRESEGKYRSLFENSPVSLWEEDFSAVRAFLSKIARQGVTDFDRYLAEHPEAVVECARRIRIVDVNQATLNLLQAESKQALLGNLEQVFTPESFGQFRRELVALAEGATRFETEGVNRTLKGEERFVDMRLSVAPECEQSLEKVFVSLVDLTGRRQMEEQLRLSLREKEFLLCEVHHRVKNNLQVISSLLSLQLKKTAEESIRTELGALRNRIRSIALLHEKLYQLPSAAGDRFAEYLGELAVHLQRIHSVDPARVRVTLEIEEIPLGFEQAIPCGMIVNELLTNALKYAFPGGRGGEVKVALARRGAGWDLSVEDTGVGIPEAVNLESGGTLGFQLVRHLAEQMQAAVHVDRRAGTRVMVRAR